MIYNKIQNKIQNALKIPFTLGLIFISLFIASCTDSRISVGADGVTLRINEYQIHNEKTLRDAMWNTPDWIEIHNYGEESVWLGDKYLSDNSDNLAKYQMPDIYIEPHCFVLVYASSQSESAEYEIHANFKLSEDDEQIYLSSIDEIIDYCDIDDLPDDISAGHNDKGNWVYFETPSPGVANIGKGSRTMNIQPAYLEILPIQINEYMSANKYTLKDDAGESPDWIELYNPNDVSVNLGDYYISDDTSKRCKCRLPEYELKSGEYLLVYAVGDEETESQEICVNFSIGVNDTNIVLSAYTGVQIDICYIDPLPQDISAGISESGQWQYFAQPTPAQQNTTVSSDTYYIEPVRISTSQLVINEIMPNNKYGIVDSYGDTSDWVELYNPTDSDVSLAGFALTDDSNYLDKWLFAQDAQIGAHDYLLVFLSGKNSINNEIHANFAMSETDDKIYLVEPNGAIASSLQIESLPGNVSKARLEDGTYAYFTSPTPGSENIGFYHTIIKYDEDILLGDLYISEVSAGSFDYYNTSYNYYEEYVEIHNTSENAINLSGYALQISSQQWIFPSRYIAPKGYLVIQLKGKEVNSQNVITADMSLSSAGECIVLTNSDGIIIDSFESGFLTGGVSSGRIDGQGSMRYFFAEKTPNKTNSSQTYLSYCSAPSFSSNGGIVDEEKTVLAMKCKEGETIHYTVDGSKPTERSYEYSGPILLDSDIVIRAASFAEGKLHSKIITRTFIFEKKHELPIVCLTSDYANLFSDTKGIYSNGENYIENEYPHTSANYWRNRECETAFEYYNENNDLALSFDAGLQIAGQYSREYDQKSLVVRIRDEYGTGEIYFPFFENSDVNEYKHILLRNSGQDIGYTKIKDYFIHKSVKGYSDIDIMDGKPVVVYINGMYWGLYNLREKQNEDYLASHYGIDKDNITIIKSINTLIAGNTDEWNELIRFIKKNSFSGDEMYSQLTTMLDVESFIDYIIIQTFYGNYDIGNIKYWKENGNGKWRPLLYDMDMALTERTSHINYIDVYFRENEYTTIFRALFENQKFRDAFSQRYAYFLNNVFTKENLFSLIDNISNEIDSEIKYQDERFNYPSSYELWEINIDEMKQTILTRRQLSVEHLQVVLGLSDEVIEDMFDWYY